MNVIRDNPVSQLYNLDRFYMLGYREPMNKITRNVQDKKPQLNR